MNFLMLDDIIKNALKEDIGTGDITTMATIPEDKQISGRFIAKECGVICGIAVVKRVFALIDDKINVEVFFDDGCFVEKGAVIAQISGNAGAILTGERVALNFFQHLSGIATYTKQCVDEVKGTKAKIADTRKTTPGLRVLEKYAVKTGGGSNHRYNLSDGVLLKDNHIKAAGGIETAIKRARATIPHTLKIEVEVENHQMVEQAVMCKADIIMLDNMSNEEMAKEVEFINGRAVVEASGNMGGKNLLEVAKAGVDIISIGTLTHTVKAMDISLRF